MSQCEIIINKQQQQTWYEVSGIYHTKYTNERHVQQYSSVPIVLMVALPLRGIPVRLHASRIVMKRQLSSRVLFARDFVVDTSPSSKHIPVQRISRKFELRIRKKQTNRKYFEVFTGVDSFTSHFYSPASG